ncbi:MAG: hypothetical protein F6J98_48515 [Moorea sp. SIO4G2]|nr:hypothetical protein [Moorena sp. SIO4G2]
MGRGYDGVTVTLHRKTNTLCPTPYSLLPAPCSLKPRTIYLTQFRTTID